MAKKYILSPSTYEATRERIPIPRDSKCCANCFFERFRDKKESDDVFIRSLGCPVAKSHYKVSKRSVYYCISFIRRSVAYLLKKNASVVLDHIRIVAKKLPVAKKLSS